MFQLFPLARAVGFRSRAATVIAGSLGLTGFLGLATLMSAHAVAGEWPSKVEATYTVSFNGFNIGDFKFRAHVGPRGYSLDGDAQISALLGVVNWRGLTRSTGRVAKRRPSPDGYVFNFRSGNKGGAIKLGFEGERVTRVDQRPQLPVKPGEIPLKPSHLKGVLDPLSAVMAMTKPKSRNPCEQTLKVFDGKQRFNLALSYKKQEAVGQLRTAGQPGIAIVCAISYQPISGYTPSAETHRLSQGQALEIALRPVPGADMYIPHEIRISTMAGPVRLTANQIHITTGRERIALVTR
ncbi:MAG: DUF3108 domain-containing protein [Pseudomonadota bacterium]